MDRSDRIGLGAALVLHLGVLGGLWVSQLERPTPPVPPPPAVDVSLVEEVGLKSSAPKSVVAPAPSQAPDPGPPEEAPPPPPVAKPEPPKPQPPKPQPPEPKRAEPPPKPAPVVAKPAPPKPAPPKPTPAKPREVATAAPTKAAKPTAKPAPTPPASAKPAAKLAAKPGTGTQVAATKPRPRGSRLSDDIVAGLTDSPSPSRVVAPVGVVIDARALAGIEDAIRRQIQPCADRLSSAGIPQEARRIVIKFNLRLQRDGNLAATPKVLDRLNTDAETERYAQQIADIGLAAFKQCAPLRLPAEFYQTANGGWSNINYRWQLR